MIEPHHVYKRYTSQIKHNTILLVKQQQLYASQQRQEQRLEMNKTSNKQDGSILFKLDTQKNLEPIVLKKFEEYFKKSIEQTNKSKTLNKTLHQSNHLSTLSPKKMQKNPPITPISSQDLAKLISRQHPTIESSAKKQLKFNVYSSRSRNQPLASQQKEKNFSIIQETIKDQKAYETCSGPFQFVGRHRKLNKSTDLTFLLNRTVTQCQQKSVQLERGANSNWNKNPSGNGYGNEGEPVDFGYLKIESSLLADRKQQTAIQQQNSSNQGTEAAKPSKQEQLKKSIRTKLLTRKRVLEQSYRQKIRSRSPSPTKHPIKINFLQYINPINKEQFTLSDVLKVSMTNSMIDEVKLNMNGCFFSVYVAQGNNSDLIKTIVRSISGWRVAELPEVANFVWTQSYRKNLLEKKPKKIIRDEILESEHEISKSPQKLSDSPRSPKFNKFNQTFLVSRNATSKNSESGGFLMKRRSLQKIQLESRAKIPSTVNNNEQNCTQLSLNLSKQNSIQQSYSYENELKKLLPQSFDMQNFILKNEKDFKRVTITPNYLIHNHLIGHRSISDKKNLLFNLRKFYLSNHINPFDFIPESHDIANFDDDFIRKQNEIFVKEKEKAEIMKKEVWIVKPGEDSNRGRGIIVCKGWEEVVKEIGKRMKEEKIENDQEQQDGTPQKDSQQVTAKSLQSPSKQMKSQKKPPRTVILQRYLLPLLYQGRKFDIRSYLLVTYVNNVLNGYFYDQCYIRTSSKQFDIDSQNKYVHLTNDAIQSMSHEYGKYEEGNKVAEHMFAKYFDGMTTRNDGKMWTDVKKEMAERCKDILKSSSKKLVGKFGSHSSGQYIQPHTDSNLLKSRSVSISQQSLSKERTPSLFLNPSHLQKQTQMSFELFGLDFMIDQQSKLWLIEVNTNPAITHDCSRVLGKLIPKLLENTFAIAVMPYMRPSRINDSSVYNNMFRHVYQEVID